MILTTLVSVTHQTFTRLLFFADSSLVAIAFITDLSSLKRKIKKEFRNALFQLVSLTSVQLYSNNPLWKLSHIKSALL